MLRSPAVNPLDITEILMRVGEFIPIWKQPFGIAVFQPDNLLSCLSVSRHFRNSLLPVLWYTYDATAMRAVPHELVQKYAIHIRILNNYGFKLLSSGSISSDYTCPPPTYFASCTNLIDYSGDDSITVDILKQNRGLRRLIHHCYYHNSDQSIYAIPTNQELFNGLHHLESLDLFGYSYTDARMVRNILRPLSSTLVKLYIYDGKFLKDTESDRLVLPKIKLLYVCRREFGMTRNLPIVFPNLETLYTITQIGTLPGDDADDLEEIFRSQRCPKLNNLYIRARLHNENLLVKTLDSHPGFVNLVLMIHNDNDVMERAISRHGGTLKDLRISKFLTGMNPNFLINIVKSCVQLTSLNVAFQSQSIKSIESMLDRNIWKNPDSLERVTFRCGELGAAIGSIKEADQLILAEDGSHFGWRVHGDRKDYNITSLEKVFKLAQDFSNLKTICLNALKHTRIHC